MFSNHQKKSQNPTLVRPYRLRTNHEWVSVVSPPFLEHILVQGFSHIWEERRREHFSPKEVCSDYREYHDDQKEEKGHEHPICDLAYRHRKLSNYQANQ